jgi:acetolactate synthase-1/2/3 large subunit
MVKMSGGEALAKSLVSEGVDVVFGIPGIQMYGIIAALRDEPGIRMITPRHEQPRRTWPTDTLGHRESRE